MEVRCVRTSTQPSNLKGTRPKGDGMVLSPFLCDGVVEFPVNGLYHGLTDGDGRLA